MGRLNYVNRKIEGDKLAQVISKDLLKRIPPGAASKAAFRDPVLEIDVSGKHLGDDGIAKFFPALVKSIEYEGKQGKVVILEDLCLKHNGLTISTLRQLKQIIELTPTHLRDLDLSGNLITVETVDDVKTWEYFLQSFAKCCVLRRLNLSGNALGTKAFEVLAKVFAQEGPLSPFAFDDLLQHGDTRDDSAEVAETFSSAKAAQHTIGSNGDVDYKGEANKQPITENSFSDHDHKLSGKHGLHSLGQDELIRYSQSKGLRSIPYIVLSDTTLDDAGAFHLSHVIAAHYIPKHLLTLIPFIKSGPIHQQLHAYDTQSRCRGVIHLPNERLSETGLKLLELADKKRDQLVEESSSELTSSLEDVSSQPNAHVLSAARSTTSQPSPRQHRRDLSVVAIESGLRHQTLKPVNDLERIRNRVQVEMLDREGRLENDLWRAAISMLSVGRIILLGTPIPRRKLQNIPVPLSVNHRPEPAQPQHAVRHNHTERQMSYGAAVFPSPNTNRMIPTGWPPRYQETSLTEQVTGPRSPNASITSRNSSPLASHPALLGRQPHVLTEKPYRTTLPCGFSRSIWRRIIGHATGANGLLSERQQGLVILRAMDKSTLGKEREYQGQKTSSQIWHLLDDIACHAYE